MAEARALILHDDLHRTHFAAGHPERPERVVAVVRRLRGDATVASRLDWRTPRDATVEDLELAHEPAHPASIAALAGFGGGWIDGDTYCNPSSYAVALRACGAALDAVDAVCTDRTTPLAYALCRPPGHHATRDAAMGFCLFNNVAVAAQHARARHGVERIAVVDIDVHHGNGTQDIFWDDPDVLYCSLHRYPFYPGTGDAEERGGRGAPDATVNVPLRAGVTGPEWLQQFDDAVLPALLRHRPQLVLVSAGYDAHVEDPLADACLDDSTYREAARRIGTVAAQYAGGRTVWALEGGYDLPALGRSVVASLQGMLA